MSIGPNISKIAALIGDESRASILVQLLTGRALPASELAQEARITPQTASSHLAKLVEGGLLVRKSCGRHKYYQLANEEVARALESLSIIAPANPIRSLRQSDRTQQLHFARTCYDHLAGAVGVAVTDALVRCSYIEVYEEYCTVTTRGGVWLASLGIDAAALQKTKRKFAYPCLDWSERRPHLAGALGAALTKTWFQLAWIRRTTDGRAVQLTEDGVCGFRTVLGIEDVSRMAQEKTHATS